MLNYLLLLLILILPVRIQDRNGRTIGYTQQQGNRTYYLNRYYQRQFSIQKGKSQTIQPKYK